MNRHVPIIIAGFALAFGCTERPKEPAPVPAPATPTAIPSPPAPPPNARIPTPGTVQKGECPLAIEPGRALGPVQLGSTRRQLEQTGLTITQVHDIDGEQMVRVGPYQARSCDGRVTEAWLDDLRLAPDCVTIAGKPVPRDIPREDLIARFDDCHELSPRIGGTFTECAGGGVRIGYGMGDFVQIRVGLPGIELDDDCRHVLDDGSPVDLSPDEFGPMLEQTVDLDVLGPYWHPELDGRQPLRIVLGQPAPYRVQFNKFGSPVVYVDAAAAANSSLPAFEVTSVTATATTARIEFRYAVEGLAGSTTFRHRMDQWVMTGHELAER